MVQFSFSAIYGQIQVNFPEQRDGHGGFPNIKTLFYKNFFVCVWLGGGGQIMYTPAKSALK